MCLWCKDENADYNDGTLCLMHQAENEGMSIASIEKRDRIQYAEYLDTLS